MDTIIASRHAPTVKLRCATCGGIDILGDRQSRRKHQKGRPHICLVCRRLPPVRPPTQAHYNYWLQRYTLEQIQEMGRAIWG